MAQDERLDFLLRSLLAEREEYADISIPNALSGRRRLLRGLMNVRPPVPASEDFLKVQDCLSEGAPCGARYHKARGDLTPVRTGLYIWQGDITTPCRRCHR